MASVQDVIHYFKDKEEVEFDTETEGFDPYTCGLISAQFGDYKNQFVVDTRTVDIKLFKELLESKTILMQNAKFDLRFLYHNNIWPTKVYDTFLAESVLNMGRKNVKKSLDALVSRYAKEYMSKEVRGVIHKEGLSKRVIEYAARDVKYLGMIKEHQLEKIKSLNLTSALNLDNKFVKVLAYVEYCGFYLDSNKWSTKMDKDQQRLENAEKVLDNYIFDNNMVKYIDNQLDMFSTDKSTLINWSSSHQVIELFKDIGIDTKVKDKDTGKLKDSVDSRHIIAQAKKFEIIPLFMEYQKASKVVSTFGKSVLKQVHPTTTRIHTTYRQLMDTGRMSCGGKNRGTREEYINLQQIPADESHRSCFTAQEGNKLIVADYSGQESVVFANFSQDPEIIAFYKKGMGDMHSFIASKIYPELEGLDLTTIKSEHKQKRQNAKGAGFAIQYGGVGATIANNLNLSMEEGEEIYNGYFKAFPGVKDYFAKCKGRALAKGYVELNPISKRKSFVDFYDQYKGLKAEIDGECFWDDYRSHKERDTVEFRTYYKPTVREYFKFRGMIERKSLNYPIQGSSAEITKFAALKFFNYLINAKLQNTVKVCNIVHDEIVIECPEDLAPRMARYLQECMEEAGKPFCKIIPLKAEPCITDHWEH
jgi:DNA polymerase-1